jgi:hypothetical protein
MKPKINEAFEEWWNREGQFLDPDTSEVPWFDKRKSLAEMAFEKATAQSRNYVANRETNPTEITFKNGRVVIFKSGFLTVVG